MLVEAAIALAVGQPTLSTPRSEASLEAELRVAVERMGPTDACNFPKPAAHDLLVVIGAYEGAAVPTVTVAGQDESTLLADIVIGKGTNPIYLALTSFDPIIWRFSGEVERVRQLAVVHNQSAGVVGIPKSRIRFTPASDCRLSYNVYRGRWVENEVPPLAIFGRRANLIGGHYDLYRAILDDAELTIEKPKVIADRSGATALENEFYRHFPAGIVRIDPRKVVATGEVEPYQVLPATAGALQLERAGALVRGTDADIRRWKNRALLRGYVRADRIDHLHFHTPYRVTTPIRFPSGLCGGYSLTFLAPSPDYLLGARCHSDVFFEDGTMLNPPSWLLEPQ